MERVAFIIEETGQRLSCMLNPEGLIVRRTAGVRSQQSLNGQLTGIGLNEDALLYTGGGRTEFQLDLLFDTNLLGASVPAGDVRDSTAPLWRLAENARQPDQYGRPPLARFVWGKAWNVLGIVTAVAERFEQFTADGVPQRSWLRLAFLRVNEAGTTAPNQANGLIENDQLLSELLENLPDSPTPALISADDDAILGIHTMTGDGTVGEILPLVIYQYGLDPAFWPLVAWFNDIVDPLRMAAGSVIRIPALSFLRRLL